MEKAFSKPTLHREEDGKTKRVANLARNNTSEHYSPEYVETANCVLSIHGRDTIRSADCVNLLKPSILHTFVLGLVIAM